MRPWLITLAAAVVAGVPTTEAKIERAYQTYARVMMQVEPLIKPDPAGSAGLEKELLRRGVTFNAAKKDLPVTDLKAVPEHYRDAFAVPWCIMELSKITNDVLPLIRDIPVTHLILDQSKTVDLSPVKEMPLIELSIRATRISDLSPLKGKKLYAIDLRESKVTDISSLEGMPLDMLDLTFTGVRDISPVERIPSLETLFLSFSSVTDITVVAKTQLKRLYLPENISVGLDLLRKNQTITHIGYGDSDFLPVQEFWTKFDAGELKPSAIKWKPKAEQGAAPLPSAPQTGPSEGAR